MSSILEKFYTKVFIKFFAKNNPKKISKLTAAGKWKEASRLLTMGSYPLQIQFLEETGWTNSVVQWNARSQENCFFTFNPNLPNNQVRILTTRLLLLLPLIIAFHRSKDFVAGTVFINLGDYANVDGLSFCSNRNNQILIPDTDFLESRGYNHTRNHFELNPVPWELRKPVALWRGNTTGIRSGDSWRTIPRVQLCEICSGPEVISLFDVGLSGLAQIPKGEIKALEGSSLMRGYVPMLTSNQYKFQIDIDGNSNAWAGLFQKLLSKSAVLKIASPHGFRQWYYDRLIPWKHFVPVESDMGDLVEKTQWLIANDAKAMQIGQQGAEFASSLTYDAVINEALQKIRIAFIENGST